MAALHRRRLAVRQRRPGIVAAGDAMSAQRSSFSSRVWSPPWRGLKPRSSFRSFRFGSLDPESEFVPYRVEPGSLASRGPDGLRSGPRRLAVSAFMPRGCPAGAAAG
jgi:hypothetical protein